MEWHPCDRKATYKSESAARTKLRDMKRRVIDPFRLSVYRCERHNGWHIGNVPLHRRSQLSDLETKDLTTKST